MMSSKMNPVRDSKNGFSPNLNGRRALFPLGTNDIANDTDSDLGHISPLNFDSNSDNEDVNSVSKNSLFQDTSTSRSLRDYDILGVVQNDSSDVFTPKQNKMMDCIESMSPLYLSPYVQSRLSKINAFSSPSVNSPTEKLKTPHDASTVHSKVPKLLHKSFLDSCVSDSACKRKIAHDTTPVNNKLAKLDSNDHSRVRTELFPDSDLSLPSNTFYPKSEEKINKPLLGNTKMKVLNDNTKKHVTRKTSKVKRANGQINAGVKHSIRKPKNRKLSNKVLLKALNIINDPVMQDYLNELENIEKPVKNLIQNKENIPNLIKYGKKRSHSPNRETSTKVFKKDNNSVVIKTTNIQTDALDLESTDLDATLSTNIDTIISTLDQSIAMPETNTALTRVVEPPISSNAITDQTESIADILLSPTSQMCDMASGLALNSPKKVKNLTPLLESMSENSNNSQTSAVAGKRLQKLFPIFATGYKSELPKVVETGRTKLKAVKKKRNVAPDQMLLDAGQKKFGVTQCSQCEFVYHLGDEKDEEMHESFHYAQHAFKLNGWKNERVVTAYGNSRIIKILPTDSKIWWKKVSGIMEVIDRELGFYETNVCLENTQVYFYVNNKTVVGCVTVVQKDIAYKMLTCDTSGVDLYSEEEYPAKCGISRLWVSSEFRRNGVATALLHAVRTNFMLGTVLKDTDIAMSSPTEMGKCFARKYFKTNNYLIYIN